MQDKTKSTARAGAPTGEPFDFLPERQPGVIAKNNFKYKSLSNWTFNISVEQELGKSLILDRTLQRRTDMKAQPASLYG